MPSPPAILDDLLTDSLYGSRRQQALKDFAIQSDWRPCDVLEAPPDSPFKDHLLVEHGFEPSAMISFLANPKSFTRLSDIDTYRLLSMSYNNLIEWHLIFDTTGLTIVFNLQDPIAPKHVSTDSPERYWHASAFEQLTAQRPHPNLKRLDDALIMTISDWRRLLTADFNLSLDSGAISTLFNAIILARAAEDIARPPYASEPRKSMLVDKIQQIDQPTLKNCITAVLTELGHDATWHSFLDPSQLSLFDSLDPHTLRRLFLDFYTNKYARLYSYDFSLISKHALSRIYERYVTRLLEDISPQTEFIPSLPRECRDRTMGTVYTPQFIARFFARILRENHTPPKFRKLRVLDPACGSGIFLRTLLEFQCDPLTVDDPSMAAQAAFQSAYGLDINDDACNATRLSLALLHLSSTANFPTLLNIQRVNTLASFSRTEYPFTTQEQPFDAVIANPPFIAWDSIPQDIRDFAVHILANEKKGKPDLSYAFLRLGTQVVASSGFLLYVLPHSFLATSSASAIRRRLAQDFWIRYLIDLSDVQVFEDADAYVTLLVLQRKPVHQEAAASFDVPRAIVAKCRDFAGQCLQDVLDAKTTNTPYYQISDVEQSAFHNDDWLQAFHPPNEVLGQGEFFCNLGDIFEIREGIVTGADDIFLVPKESVPKDERDIYIPLLSDREMLTYSLPKLFTKYVFFPVSEGVQLNEDDVKTRYPRTWSYLCRHETQLRARRSVATSGNPWWRPIRLRATYMLQPKIVCPHLLLTPRFSLDEEGTVAVSHCPVLYPKTPVDARNELRLMLAILNSPVTHWQLSQQSHKYNRGYLMLEPKTLKNLRVPLPSRLLPGDIVSILSAVEKLYRKPTLGGPRASIDAILARIYNLTPDLKQTLGIQ